MKSRNAKCEKCPFSAGRHIIGRFFVIANDVIGDENLSGDVRTTGKSGCHAVAASLGFFIGKTACDQFIECTMDRDTKHGRCQLPVALVAQFGRDGIHDVGDADPVVVAQHLVDLLGALRKFRHDVLLAPFSCFLLALAVGFPILGLPELLNLKPLRIERRDVSHAVARALHRLQIIERKVDQFAKPVGIGCAPVGIRLIDIVIDAAAARPRSHVRHLRGWQTLLQQTVQKPFVQVIGQASLAGIVPPDRPQIGPGQRI
jgi:hypothetical protein